jgi:hypothetical protein
MQITIQIAGDEYTLTRDDILRVSKSARPERINTFYVEFKSEYFAGEMFAMAGASQRHNLIAANIIRTLGNQLLERPCSVYPSDMRVKSAKSTSTPILTLLSPATKNNSRMKGRLCKGRVAHPEAQHHHQLHADLAPLSGGFHAPPGDDVRRLKISPRSPTPTAARTSFCCCTPDKRERGSPWSICRRGPVGPDGPSSVRQAGSAVGNRNKSQRHACASTIRNGAAPAPGSSRAGCRPC